MINQCVNAGCWKTFQDHGSKCTSCGHSLISTPDPGSSYENSPQAHISRGNPSPANSSPFLLGLNSPTSYGSPAMHLDAPAFSHLHTVHNLPAPHTSPGLRNVQPPYQRAEYSPRTTFPNPYDTTSILSTIPSPISASTLKDSSLSSSQSDSRVVASLQNTSFEEYDPKTDKSAGDKMRSCVSCYRGNRPCRTNKGEISCQSCVGKAKYCRGVIRTPGLVDTQPWFQTTASLIADRCRSYGEELYLYDIQVRLKISSKKDENLLARARAQMLQNYHLDLRRLHTNTTTSDDHSQLTGILDMVCPGSTRATEKSTNAKPELLDSCQSLARRFVTCLMTLRNLRVCTLNTTFCKPAAPYIVLEFLRQLINQACYLFGEFFNALNIFLEGPRKKNAFKHQLFTLASTLGQIYKALQSFVSGLEDVAVPQLDITALYRTLPITLEELQYWGNFFNPEGFRAGPEMLPSELPGIHIELLSPAGGLVNGIAKRQLGASVTFLDVLQRSLCVDIGRATDAADYFEPKSPTKVEGLSCADGSPCRDGMSVKSPLPRQRSPKVENQFSDIPSHERHKLEEQCRLQISELQNLLKEEIENHRAEVDRHRTRKLELEERLVLLSLSLGLDVPTQNKPTSRGMFGKENSQQEPVSPDLSPSPGAITLVEHSDTSNIEARIHTSSKGSPSTEPTQPSPINVEANDTAVTVMRSSMSGHGSEVTFHNAPDHVSSANSKRKRISDYFPSFKKHRLAETIDRMDALHASSKSSKHRDLSRKPGSASNDFATAGFPVKKRISQIFTSHPPHLNRKLPAHNKVPCCKDIVPAMSQSNPGSDRPLSWPRSVRWRKSFGVSVKTLREGFEKMTVEQMEPVPPLPPST